MNIYRHILQLDLRQLVRDRSLWVFVMMPFLMTPLMRWGWPWLVEWVPELSGWGAHAMILMASVLALTPAILWGLPMLEEKSGQLWSVWNSSPVPLWKWLGIRLGSATFLSMIFAGTFLALGGEMRITRLDWALLTGLMGLLAPTFTLMVLALASNQVEGLTVFKGLNVLIVIPLVLSALDISPGWSMLLPTEGLYQFADGLAWTSGLFLRSTLIMLGWLLGSYVWLWWRNGKTW
ncbi:MAG: hypothetical protein AAFV07_03510 [Bacteroidota bacterium]